MIRFFIPVLLLILIAPSPVLAMSENIAVVVNKDAITRSDVNDRTTMIVGSSGLPNNAETRSRLRGQVVSGLIDEQIRLQEAERLELEVSESEINKGFSTLAQQNKMSYGEFRKVIENRGVPIHTMERQIASQIAWSKVVQARIRPQVNISDSDIDERLARLSRNIGKTEYLSAEVYLPVESPRKEAEVRSLAQKLSAQLREGNASFFRVAQQFSKAPGAPKGGDMGWVQEGQLEEKLDAALRKLQKGQASAPVKGANGYHIFFVREKRTITEGNIPTREQVRQQLGVERLERAARRYFMDLKSATFIDNRL